MGAKIKLTVTSNFARASKDIKIFGAVTEQEAKRIKAGLKKVNQINLDAFVQKNKRAAAAITATRGKMAGLKSENLQLQRKMEMMIRNGIDPQDKALNRLKAEYIQTTEAIRKMEAQQVATNQAMEDGKKVALAMGVALATVSAKGTIDQAEYARQIANVNTLIEISENEFAALDNTLEQLSGTFAIQKQELASGVYQAASAGASDLNEALVIVEKSAQLGRAALLQNTQAVDIITTAMNAYGEEVIDAAKASDIFFQIIKKGKINGEQLSATIGQSITLFAGAKIPLEELGAGIATMTKVGTKASEATTQLNAVVSAFIKPSTDMTAALEAQGYASGSALLEAEGLAGAMQFLRDRTGGSNERMVKLLPNIRAMRGAMALMSEEGNVLNEVMVDFIDVSGSTEEALAAQTDGFAKDVFTVEQSIIAMQNLSMTIGEKVLPILGKLANFIVILTTDFSSLSTPVKLLMVYIPILTAGLIAMTIAMNISAIVTIVIAKLGLLTVGVQLLGAAIAANPVGAFAIALTAVGTAITFAVTDKFNEAADAVAGWAGIGSAGLREMSTKLKAYSEIKSIPWGDRSREQKAALREMGNQIESLSGHTLRWNEDTNEAYLDLKNGATQTIQQLDTIASAYEKNTITKAANAAAAAKIATDQAASENAAIQLALDNEERLLKAREKAQELWLSNQKQAVKVVEQLTLDTAMRGMDTLERETFMLNSEYAKRLVLLKTYYADNTTLATELETSRNEALVELRDKHSNTEERTLRNRLSTQAGIQAEARAAQLADLSSYYTTITSVEQGGAEAKIARMWVEWDRVNELTKLTNEERAIAKQAIEDRITAIEENAASKSDTILQRRLATFRKIGGSFVAMFNLIDKQTENSGKKARALAVTQKSLAVAMIAINTALAVSQALRDPTPMPSSLRIAQAVGVGAYGLAQGIAAAATPIPSAETGGSFEASSGGVQRVDSNLIAINDGETAEITPRGESSSKDLTAVIVLNDEVLWEGTQRGIDAGRITFTDLNLV